MCSQEFGFVREGETMEGRGRGRWRIAGGGEEEREGLEAKRKVKREEDGETKRWDGVLRKGKGDRK